MNASVGRQLLAFALGIMALLASGCADLPAWVPFQGPRSDDVPGVVTPAAKITQLKKLSSEAPQADAQAKHRVAEQLVGAIRTETDAMIRAEIIRTLGDYPDPVADGVLRAALNDPDTDVRIAACEAWGKHGGAEAADLLAPILTSDMNRDVRLASARALGKIKDQRALAALGDALTDSDPSMQYRAVLSLKELTGQDLGNNVDRWRQYVKEGHPLQSQPTSVADRLKNIF